MREQLTDPGQGRVDQRRTGTVRGVPTIASKTRPSQQVDIVGVGKADQPWVDCSIGAARINVIIMNQASCG